MPESRDDYLKWAAECLSVSQETREQVTKAMMLKMAQAWISLAERANQREAQDH